MRSIIACSTKACLLVMAAFCVGALSVLGDGDIDPTNKYAWAENAGWANFAPTNGGVTVTSWGFGHTGHLSGYAWVENAGWLKLGNDNGGPYQNTDANDWGVNIAASGGGLAGYAWSENCGWISFNPTYGQVTIGGEGRFDGYAWAENIGWIHFKNATPAYNVQTMARLRNGMVFSIY